MNARPYIFGCLCLVGATGTAAASDIDPTGSLLSLGGTVVTADLWDVEGLPACGVCRTRRIERLARLNVTGRCEPRVACDACAA